MDILPRCIDITDSHGETHPRYYAHQLIETIGRGAYDCEGHKNAKFLEATQVGPFPEACGRVWTHVRQEAIENYELRE